MPLPDVTTVIRDGALGLIATNTTGQHAVIGIASSGTSNVPVAIGDIQTLVNTFGSGPLVEAGAHALQIGGGPIIAMRITAAAAGTNGTVVKLGTGLSVGSLTGTPVDDYDVIVRIVAGGTNPAANTTTFQYSLDGGRTWSAIISLPSSGIYVLPNTGVTITFSAATLVAGDTYSFHETAPAFTNTELATALDALISDSSSWFLVHVAGIPSDAATLAAMFATVDSKLLGAATNYARYVFGLLQAPDLTDSALATAAASLASVRTAVAAGFASLTSAISGSGYKRPVSWVAAARASAVPPSEDIGRVASGPVTGVQALFRDEFKSPSLDAARFITLRTYIGLPGFYLTRGVMMAPAGSDYGFITNRRVVDIGTSVGRNALLQYVNDSVRVNRVSGLIFESDARSIEGRVEGLERAALTQPGFASDVSVVVDRTINILSTSQLKATIRVLPLAYARYITEDIGLTNPALQPA